MNALTDEARLFVRMSVFGLATGAIYWFLTGERAKEKEQLAQR